MIFPEKPAQRAARKRTDMGTMNDPWQCKIIIICSQQKKTNTPDQTLKKYMNHKHFNANQAAVTGQKISLSGVTPDSVNPCDSKATVHPLAFQPAL